MRHILPVILIGLIIASFPVEDTWLMFLLYTDIFFVMYIMIRFDQEYERKKMSEILKNNDKQFLKDLKSARHIFVYARGSDTSFLVTKKAVRFEAANIKIRYRMFNDKNDNPNMLIE